MFSLKRTLVPVLTLVSLVGAGCIGSTDDLGFGDPVQLPDVSLPLFENDRVKMDVELQVVLIGFPDESVQYFQEHLVTETADHRVSDFNQVFPPDPDEGVEGNAPLLGDQWPVPMLPTANYKVMAAPEPVEAGLVALLPDIVVDDSGDVTVYDANAAEAYLAEALPTAGGTGHGIALDPNAPSLVIMHLDAYDIPVHGWRYDFPHGHLQLLNSFGEKEAMHILDPSATKDPQQPLVNGVIDTATGAEREPYSDRLAAEGDDLDAIAKLVYRSVHLRFLHSAIYPMPLVDCHAMTLIYAYRPTELAPHMGLPSGEELFRPAEIESAFENLTGDEVHVDSKVLLLPVDDPVLDALARGEFATLEAQRAWLTMNWQDYWVEHEGCEPYVSFVIHGDVASVGSGIIGIGTYDESKSYRISLSWVNEAFRHAFDSDSPVAQAADVGDATGMYNWVQFLFTHEIGHTIGMHHPFHNGHGAQGDDATSGDTHFENVWTSMSYSTDGRVIDFSTIDKATYQRNQVAYLAQAAAEAGLVDTDPWNDALWHTGMYHWQTATETLQGALFDEGSEAEIPEGGFSWMPGELVLMPSPSSGVHGYGAPGEDAHGHRH